MKSKISPDQKLIVCGVEFRLVDDMKHTEGSPDVRTDHSRRHFISVFFVESLCVLRGNSCKRGIALTSTCVFHYEIDLRSGVDDLVELDNVGMSNAPEDLDLATHLRKKVIKDRSQQGVGDGKR